MFRWLCLAADCDADTALVLILALSFHALLTLMAALHRMMACLKPDSFLGIYTELYGESVTNDS